MLYCFSTNTSRLEHTLTVIESVVRSKDVAIDGVAMDTGKGMLMF